ncbi:hypothetical protein JHK87_043259 [Glycine soja]|nr:hypothetical protein JHK87_043259 [Glycine soja]
MAGCNAVEISQMKGADSVVVDVVASPHSGVLETITTVAFEGMVGSALVVTIAALLAVVGESMAHAPNREYDLGGNWLGALLLPMKAPCELLVDDP